MAIATDYAGLFLWYLANAGDWSDQSGNGNDAVEPNIDQLPVVAEGVANGNDVFWFDLNSQTYVTLPDMSALTQGEMFAVVRQISDPASGFNDNGIWDFSTEIATSGTLFPFTDGNVYENWGSTTRKNCGNPVLGLSNEFRVVNIWSAPGNWGISIDDSLLFGSASNVVGFPVAPKIGVVNRSAAIRYNSARLPELFVYNQLRTSAERTSLINTLKATYQGNYKLVTKVIASQLVQVSGSGGTGGTGGGPGGLGDVGGGAAWIKSVG